MHNMPNGLKQSCGFCFWTLFLYLLNIVYHVIRLNCGNSPHSCHMSLILLGLVVSVLAFFFSYTIIKQMFYKEKHLTLHYLSLNPYVVYEGIKRTTHKQPN